MVSKQDCRLARRLPFPLHLDREIPTSHAKKTMEVLAIIALLPPSCVLVAGGSAGKLVDSFFRMNGVILPMPVSTDDIGMLLGGQEFTNSIPLVTEYLI
jgi:hypothetical protein